MIADCRKCSLLGLYVLVLLLTLLSFHFIVVSSFPLECVLQEKVPGAALNRLNNQYTGPGFNRPRYANLPQPGHLNEENAHKSELLDTTQEETSIVPSDHDDEVDNGDHHNPNGDLESSNNHLKESATDVSEADEIKSADDDSELDVVERDVATTDGGDDHDDHDDNGNHHDNGSDDHDDDHDDKHDDDHDDDDDHKDDDHDDHHKDDDDHDDNGHTDDHDDDDDHSTTEDATAAGALESGNGSGESALEVDVFDKLMSSIHDHWLDFVGKMKLSVLDVWKSISSHMMNRLENFAVRI